MTFNAISCKNKGVKKTSHSSMKIICRNTVPFYNFKNQTEANLYLDQLCLIQKLQKEKIWNYTRQTFTDTKESILSIVLPEKKSDYCESIIPNAILQYENILHFEYWMNFIEKASDNYFKKIICNYAGEIISPYSVRNNYSHYEVRKGYFLVEHDKINNISSISKKYLKIEGNLITAYKKEPVIIKKIKNLKTDLMKFEKVLKTIRQS